MFYNSVMFFLGLSLFVLGANGYAVDFIDPCPINDHVCTLASAKKVMPKLVHGIPELNVLSADPLILKNKIVGDTGELKLAFEDLKVIGASKLEILKVERPEELKINLALQGPISATGLYELWGKIFHLVVEGKGNCEIDLKKIWIELYITLKKVDGSDGKTHYKVAKFDYKYDPIGDVILKFENLFNGDKDRAKPVEDLMATQPKELFSTFAGEVLTQIIKAFVNVVNEFFKAVPSEKINVA